MTQEEFEKIILAEYDNEVKDLTNQGFTQYSFPFVVAKLAVGERIAKKYQFVIRWEDAPDYRAFRVQIAHSLVRLGAGERFARLLLSIYDIPNLFRPAQVHTMDGLKFLLNWRDRKSRYIFSDYAVKDSWEPETTNLIKATLREGEVAVDVGASIGPITLQFARQVGPLGKVYSFEPTKRCFKYLEKNVALNDFSDRVELFNLGAWDKTEMVGVPRCDANPTLFPCVSIDEFLEGRGVLKVDYLKMDIDGSEPWALRGLVRTFERNPQMRIICEYYPKYIRDAGGDPQEVVDILYKYFDLYKIEGDYGEGYCNLYGTRKK